MCLLGNTIAGIWTIPLSGVDIFGLHVLRSSCFIVAVNFCIVCKNEKKQQQKKRFERLYCFHGWHVTEHVLLSTYANFRLSVFPLKSYSVEKCIINNSFKNKVRSQCQAWMMNGPFNYAPLGKKRAPSEELVLSQ